MKPLSRAGAWPAWKVGPRDWRNAEALIRLA